MAVSQSTISDLADEAIARIGSGGVWSLPLKEGDTPDQRTELIVVHDRVAQEVRRRGYPVRATVTRDEPGVEYLVLKPYPKEEER